MLRLPPGMARPHIPPNPDPSRITAAMWEFAQCFVALEPADFQFAGIYADKRGYHNTVNANMARWPNDYSVRLREDLNGVKDKSRALDVTSRSAQRGDYRIMAKYGARLRAAAKAKDPRVRCWREVLGQFDTDTPPEAIDFQSLVERQPDDTHSWHFHLGILAMFVALATAYEGMLSVLFAESLDSWNRYARYPEGGDVDLSDKNPFGTAPKQFTRADADHPLWLMDGPDGTVGAALQYLLENTHYARQFSRRAMVETVALNAVVAQLVKTIADLSGPGGVELSEAALIEAIDEKIRDALGDYAEGGAREVRENTTD